MKLTAIIPIDLSQRPFDIINKARRLARVAENSEIFIVFGHNDRGSLADAIFQRSMRGYRRTTISSQAFNTATVNASRLRNLAFSYVSTEYLLLLDVDIWPDFDLIFRHVENLKDGSDFSILPCVYLTQLGSQALQKKETTTAELTSKFFEFSRKEFLHLASPSSVTVLKTSDYERLGGFDEEFIGHGYEDFDFLIRLADLYNRIPNSSDFLDERVARSPLFSVGFRKHLGKLCFESLINKDFTFHLHHRKPQKSSYYDARKSNSQIFKTKHAFRAGDELNNETTLIKEFVDYCEVSGLSVHDYSVLFDNKPGHIDRTDTLKRRLRFVLNG